MTYVLWRRGNLASPGSQRPSLLARRSLCLVLSLSLSHPFLSVSSKLSTVARLVSRQLETREKKNRAIVLSERKLSKCDRVFGALRDEESAVFLQQ